MEVVNCLALYDLVFYCIVLGTMVPSQSGTAVVNSENNTLVESELGTMVINESDEDESTMKSR